MDLTTEKMGVQTEQAETPTSSLNAELERHPTATDEVVQDEDYRVGWRSFLAITGLALANMCAALTNTASGPVNGFLSDRAGKKWFIVGGCVFGVIGACVSGTAHDVQTIIAGQILSGVANAGCIVSVAASQEVTPNKYRPWVMGYTQTIASVSALLGVYCAGAFVVYESWRWSYYLNAFAYFIAGTTVALTYFPPPPALRRQYSLGQLFSGLDYIGIFGLSASLALLIIGITWGGVTYPWHSGPVVGTLVAGGAGLVLLGLYETFVKKDGLFDHRLFANRNFPILLFVCTIDGMLLLGVNVLYAQEIATLFSSNAIRIAVILSPYLITSLFGCLPAGILMAKTKSYRIMLVGALAWCSLFTGLMALVTPDRLSWAYAFTTLFGMGTAVTTVIPIVALALSVPSFLLGAAGTLSVSCRALGGIIGITIFTVIHDNKLDAVLPKDVAAVLAATTSLSGATEEKVYGEVLDALANAAAVSPLVSLPEITPALSKETIYAILDALSSAETVSWKYVWPAIAALVGLNALVATTAKPVDEHMNNHIESALERSETRNSQMVKV